MSKTNASIKSRYGRTTGGGCGNGNRTTFAMWVFESSSLFTSTKSDRGLRLETGPCACVYGITVNQKTV